MEENLNKKTKAELIQQILAMRGANAILEGDLKEARNDIAELEQARDSAVITDSTPALLKELECARRTISELENIVRSSCADHCPHHCDHDACANCGIHKRMEELEK